MYLKAVSEKYHAPVIDDTLIEFKALLIKIVYTTYY